MDLNKNGLMFCNGDTTLRLDCFGYGGNITAGVRGYGTYPGETGNAPDDSCKLVLGLGPTPSSGYDYYSGHPDKNKSLTNTEDDSILRLGLSGGNDDFSSMFEYSVSSRNNQNLPLRQRVISVVDEGSTSAKRSGGCMPSLLLAPTTAAGRDISFQTKELLILEPAEKSRPSPSQISSEPSALSSISSDRRTSHFKRCQFDGCSKGARGSTGLCIGHGGGQRCHKPGCNKGAESRTAFCKAHGGGKRCDHLGCTKSAEGKTDYCISHGGGRRCGHPSGCSKAARGKSGLCIRHGGGKRCKIEGCSRSAEGQIGLCISHGGGRRCQFSNCPKGAQGSTNYCKAHGGGKRCIFAGCTKGAEGSTPLCKAHGGGKRCLFDGGGICPKSVHGGTDFCVAHGGGKRCSVSGCTKSARGRTDCCVKHGGGKRCKFENCEKSAQGSTDFCKAHGGGKRCSWGEGKCEKFARGKSGLCAAHSSLVNEKGTKSKGGMIGPGLFCGLVSATSTTVSSFNSYCLSGISAISDTSQSVQHMAERQQLIPPQVLVPLSMRSSSSCSRPQGEISNAADAGRARKSSGFRGTEGRVHGGGLMLFLGGNMKNAVERI